MQTNSGQRPVPKLPPKESKAVLVVSIKGLQDDKYALEVSAETTEITGIADVFPEFVGAIHVRGDLRKIVKRYLITATASCDARLTCDVSGEEFLERIEAVLKLEYVADTRLFLEMLKKSDDDPEPPYYIRDDDTSIDLTDIVRQELIVALPLKRVAPAYRHTSFEEMFPEHAADAGNAANAPDSAETPEDAPIDPRWAALKGISFTGN
jgi:uncharacterized protein